MAVKPEIIKARLKVLFPKANLSTKRLDVYAAKLAPKPADDADDEAIDAIINDYNEVIDFVAVAAEDDRTRTLEADKKKAEEVAKNKGGKKEEEEEEEEETEGMTPFEKRMLKNFGALKSDIDSIKSGNVLETKKQTAVQSFEKSEILKGLKPELKDRWVNRIDVNSETSLEDQIKELESEYSELVQVNADSNVYGGPAGFGLSKSEPTSEEIKAIYEG
jgi:hypothetical protein